MILLILFFSTLLSFGTTDFNLKHVHVECGTSETCSQRAVRFKSLAGDYRSIVHLKDTLRVMASDGGYQKFTYQLIEKDNIFSLGIQFSLKPIINEIDLKFEDRNYEYDTHQLLTLKEGEFFEIQKLKVNMNSLRVRLENMGYPDNQASYEIREKGTKVNLKINITLGKPRIFKTIKSNSSSIFVRNFLHRKFLNFYNKPFDINSFKIYLDDAQKELFNYGYYLVSLDFTPIYKKNRVLLQIKVVNDQLYAFDFKNLQREHRDVVHALIIDLFRKYKRPVTEVSLKSALKEHYRNKALLNTKIRIETSTYKNKSTETVNLYRIFFDENGKTIVGDLKFTGNTYFSQAKLTKMFHTDAFELASINYYDEEYLSYFQEFLKSQYFQRGFVQARVFDPIKTFDNNKKLVSVEYGVQEGQRAYVKEISFRGIPEELENIVSAKLSNKIGKPFNPISMAEDLKSVATTLQEQGYYYAEVTNSQEADLVRYNRTSSEVRISFIVDSGPLVRLNRVLYLGNDKTRKKVLGKKVTLDKGDLITPSKTREIESAISATGLFNSVSVTPLKHNSKNAATDLLIKVVERDYGLVEIAPGYRTDLGLKLTGTVSYQNIGGYNKSIVLRSQVNRRTSFTTVDRERRDNIDHIIEHNTSFSYSQGDIFDTLIDGAASVAYQTRRFYNFDANIYRVNGTLTRDLTRRLSSSLRYQYEDISQYNATESLNNGSFKIGALTPSLSYDLRNTPVNPTKGAFFNLSSEFANPYFLSQKEQDLTINYYKVISRNRFYVPFKNGTVAVSMVGGVQKNLADSEVTRSGTKEKEGYIPTIKVFRLTGMDIIRGFTDEEMNRVPSGKDISEVRVDNMAYLANFKVEPRYFINDVLMAGVFYDAGRVYVHKMDLGELRDSVGLTFKVVTPVGTLDFDYGIKLLRKKDPSGRLEDPGRFHVSIGFF